MAFAFFRRRQKMVIIVMVILMVSFLVGMQGLTMILNRTHKEAEMGRLRDGTKITVSDLGNAKLDMMIFRRAQVIPLELEMLFRLNGDKALAAYMLLAKEAEGFGPVSEAEVDGALGRGEDGEARYRRAVSDLRSQDIPEKRFRQAVVTLIRILRAFRESQVTTPPSQAELEQFYFTVSDQVRIRYARFPAEQFVGDVNISPEQMAERLDSQFDQFKDRSPGTFDEDNPFGFGYGAPDRVAIEYLLARGNLLMRVVTPPESDLSAHFRAHEGDYTKEAPTGEVDADGEPIMRTEPKTFGEAKSEIIEQLRPAEVRDRLKNISGHAATLIREFDDHLGDKQGLTAYEYAAKQMQLPADGLLNMLLPEVRIRDELLADAMELLAEKAEIQGICYPLTDSAGQPLDEDARVTVTAESITLGEALAQIASQLGQPELTWVQCETLVGRQAILFAAGPLSIFPLMSGKTGLVDIPTLAGHPLLGMAADWTGGQRRNWLVKLAFDPSLFDAEKLAAQPLRERGFQDMEVPGEPGGRLMWRVSQVDPAHDAKERTPEIDEAIAVDIETAEAMELAREHAEVLMARARESSLGKVAEEDGIELVSVDQFSRADLRQVGVEGLVLAPSVREDFLMSLFALTTDEDRGGGPILAVIAAPSDRSVCLVELLEHIPAVLEEFEASRPAVIGTLSQRRSARLIYTWFSIDSIVERLGYERTER